MKSATLLKTPSGGQDKPQVDLTTLPPHANLLLNLPYITDPILQLQYIEFVAKQIIPDPNCPCMLCTGRTTNSLIGLEDAVQAVLVMGRQVVEVAGGTGDNDEQPYARVKRGM